MASLNFRMMAGAGAVLTAFVLLTGLALDRAFHDSAREARQERLLGQLYLLIAGAEVDPKGRLTMPPLLSEARFSLPGSGLYAQVTDQEGKLVWRSPSAAGLTIPYHTGVPPGEKRFDEQRTEEGPYFVESLGVIWSTAKGRHHFTFSVSEDLAQYHTQLSAYRQSLWGWLGLMSVLMLIMQALVLRWGLLPMRRVAREIALIENGRRERIEGRYPREIRLLTDRLNMLLHHERARQNRYRDALGDLAHSLKTPLAVIRGVLSDRKEGSDLRQAIEEEVQRMDHTVQYQLQRAATAGASSNLAARVELLPVVEKIVSSLKKVYHDKAVETQLQIDPDAAFRGDSGDLMELLGNLLDNAFKWCRHSVSLHARMDGETLVLEVGDDGSGVDPAQTQRILQRGARADEAAPGHGIGLAIVRDIAEAYHGAVKVGRSPLGGALFTLTLPVR